MKKYLLIIKNSLMVELTKRVNFIFKAIGNSFYVILIYFLWKAIYASSSGVLRGMTFNQTFVYVSLASAMFVLFQTWADWQLSRRIISGNIIVELIKPLDVQLYSWAFALGVTISNLITTILPSLILVFVVFKAEILIGGNIFIFGISLVLAFSLSFMFDFIVGLTSFYTESIWGISLTKEALVLFLAGAIVPLNFFPEHIRSVLEYLPFQAIYNIPLTILTSTKMNAFQYGKGLLIQLFWLIVLLIISRVFYRSATRVLTVNGG